MYQLSFCRCCCGRKDHTTEEIERGKIHSPRVQRSWKFLTHTVLTDTDAYGTIEFQGGSHPIHAQVSISSWAAHVSKMIILSTSCSM